MEKLIDMHTHTTFSDGELTPIELVELAIKKNIGVIAITDHDTIDGVKALDRENEKIKQSGIEIINGVELSAKTEKGQMHILGFNIDLDNQELNGKLNEQKTNRLYSFMGILKQIEKDYGIVFPYDEIRDLINLNHNLGRPDIAKLCIQYGYARSIDDAFKKYLIDAHEKIRGTSKKLQPEECLKLINDSNGIAVLAHPKSLELNEKEFLIVLRDLISKGLKGIEVYHSSHTKEEMEYYERIALEHDLLISGGSDYHGKTVKPDIELGTGKNNNLKIKRLSLVDEIK